MAVVLHGLLLNYSPSWPQHRVYVSLEEHGPIPLEVTQTWRYVFFLNYWGNHIALEAVGRQIILLTHLHI